MLGRLVGEMAKKEPGAYPFSRVSGVFANADLLFCNLETSLSERGFPDAEIPLRACPEMAGRLKAAGFNVVSLANNHIFNYGMEAFSDTLANLEREGIIWVGAGNNLEQARALKVIKVQGLSVGFLAYTYAYPAGPHSPGCAPVNECLIFTDVERARGLVDILVVSIHEGIEFIDYPTTGIVKTARSIIDHGGDIVLRHHPHTLQGIEKYKNGLIAYSLGDFVFDNIEEDMRTAAYKRTAVSILGPKPLDPGDLRLAQSMILECRLGVGGVHSYNIIPVMIGGDYQPRIAEGESGASILKRIKQISRPLAEPENPIWTEMEKLQKDVRLLSLNRVTLREIIRLAPRFKLRYIKNFSLLLWSKLFFLCKNFRKWRDRRRKGL